MKKRTIRLGGKLMLGKETIVHLDEQAQHRVAGGATNNHACWTSRATTPCGVCNPPAPTQRDTCGSFVNCGATENNSVCKCITIGI